MNFYIDVLMQGSMMIGGENVNDAEANAKQEMWHFAGMLFDLYYAKEPERQAELASKMYEQMHKLGLLFDSDTFIRKVNE